MSRQPPISTRTDTLLPSTALFRSPGARIRALAEGRDAAGRAEVVREVFLVEAVGAVVRFRRGQRQRLAREEREQAAAAAAHRAVAVDRVDHLALEVEGDGAAVAAVVMVNGWNPEIGKAAFWEA